MKSGITVFKEEQIPEQGLIKVATYTYYPPSEMRDKIVEDMKKNLKCDLDEYVIGIDVHVNLKEYKKKPTNDTKNS